MTINRRDLLVSIPAASAALAAGSLPAMAYTPPAQRLCEGSGPSFRLIFTPARALSHQDNVSSRYAATKHATCGRSRRSAGLPQDSGATAAPGRLQGETAIRAPIAVTT